MYIHIIRGILTIYRYVVHVKTVESANVVNVVEDDTITNPSCQFKITASTNLVNNQFFKFSKTNN